MHTIYSEDSPSAVVLSSAFSGSERVVFELRKSCDIHHTSGMNIVEKFIEKTQVSIILSSIFDSGMDLSGVIKEVWEDLEEKTDVDAISNYLMSFEDIHDGIRITFFSPVPDITEITFSVEGETTLDSIRKLSTEIIDQLSVEIFTDFCKIQCNALLS